MTRRDPLQRHPANPFLWASLQAHDEAGVRQALAQGADAALKVPTLVRGRLRPVYALELLAKDHGHHAADWASWGMELPERVLNDVIRRQPLSQVEAVWAQPKVSLRYDDRLLVSLWRRALARPRHTQVWLERWCTAKRDRGLQPWTAEQLSELCALPRMTLAWWAWAHEQGHPGTPRQTGAAWGRAWEHSHLALADALRAQSDYEDSTAVQVFSALLASHTPEDFSPDRVPALTRAWTSAEGQRHAARILADLPDQVGAWSPELARQGIWGATDAQRTYEAVLEQPASAAFRLAQHDTLHVLMAQGANPWQHPERQGLAILLTALDHDVDEHHHRAEPPIRWDQYTAWWTTVWDHPDRPPLGPWAKALSDRLPQLDWTAGRIWVEERRAQIQATLRQAALEQQPTPAMPRRVRPRA